MGNHVMSYDIMIIRCAMDEYRYQYTSSFISNGFDPK